MKNQQNNAYKKELICIRCPIGCIMTVTKDMESALQVTGNSCKRGEEYAKKELTNPTRIVTSTVRIKGRNNQVLSVKTKTDIPKEKIQACMEAIKRAEVEIPVHIGDVILYNAADTGVDIIATKNVVS